MDFGWLQGARSDGLKVLRLIEAWLRERGHPGQHVKLGMRAKALCIADNPNFTVPKKDVYANGQIIQANRWTESMRDYLERVLMEL